MAALLAVGSQAPDFRLPATTGDTVSLSHYRGTRNLILRIRRALARQVK